MDEKDYNKDPNEEENYENRKEEDSDDFGLPDVTYESSHEEDRNQEAAEEEQSYQYNEEPFQESPDRSYWEQEDQYAAKKSNNAAGPIIALSILLLVALGLVYWFVIRDDSPAEPIPDEVAQTPSYEPSNDIVDRVTEAEPVEQEPAPPVELQSQEGTVNTVSNPSGRYFVVVGSFIDDDLAMDYGQELAQEGISSTIIEPASSNKFYRLAIDSFDSWNRATNRMDELKSTFGQEIWVLKY